MSRRAYSRGPQSVLCPLAFPSDRQIPNSWAMVLCPESEGSLRSWSLGPRPPATVPAPWLAPCTPTSVSFLDDLRTLLPPVLVCSLGHRPLPVMTPSHPRYTTSPRAFDETHGVLCPVALSSASLRVLAIPASQIGNRGSEPLSKCSPTHLSDSGLGANCRTPGPIPRAQPQVSRL